MHLKRCMKSLPVTLVELCSRRFLLKFVNKITIASPQLGALVRWASREEELQRERKRVKNEMKRNENTRVAACCKLVIYVMLLIFQIYWKLLILQLIRGTWKWNSAPAGPFNGLAILEWAFCVQLELNLCFSSPFYHLNKTTSCCSYLIQLPSVKSRL